MAIEYLGLSEINGPLVVLEGVKDAAYEEIVEFSIDGEEKKLGRIVEIYEDKAVIQVFEGTDSMSLENTHTRLTGHPMEIGAVGKDSGKNLRRHRQSHRRPGPHCGRDKSKHQRASLKSRDQRGIRETISGPVFPPSTV